MYNFHDCILAQVYQSFNDQNIFQTYTYLNLITTSMAESLQNKMAMCLASYFKNRYCLHDHTLIFKNFLKIKIS